MLDDKLKVDIADIGGRTLPYYFPDEKGCQSCHADNALGPVTEQLNVELDYLPAEPASGVFNQLEQMAAIGMFTAPIGDASALPRVTRPEDVTASLQERARSYLHGNCAHCHQPGGWTPPEMDMDLRYDVPLGAARICGVKTQFDTVYKQGKLRIDPGNPTGSSLYNRMVLLGAQRMPPVGTAWSDPLGDQLVFDWISGLTCE